MQAHIITIGDEILIGQITDTNSSWLATELVKLGINVDKILSISDNKEAILHTLESSLNAVNLVIITGGLGPTSDDITKETIAEFFESEIVFSEQVYEHVLSFLNKRGAKTNELNKRQAFVPVKATILPNNQGTAPGLLFEQNNKLCLCLPGVPFEMKSIMKQYGFDAIKERFKLPHSFFYTSLITGIGESQLAERIAEWENALPNDINIAYLPSPGLIKLRLGIIGSNEAKAKQKVMAEAEKLYQQIPELIFGENDQTLHGIISEILIKNNETVATAESCTGGNLSRIFTSLPGSSAWFNGGIVAYSNQVKNRLLDIPNETIVTHGAVSKQVVELMAIGGCKKLNSDYCIATSGIAGPDGGTPQKPIGTVWIAIAKGEIVISKCFRFGKERNINIKRSTIAALNMFRKYL